MSTEVSRDPLMTGGIENALAYRKREVTGTSLLAGTALMFDAATDKYIVADTAASSNTIGWAILGEDLATAGEALVYVGGSISNDKVICAGTTFTAMTDEAIDIFRMNGIEIKQETF